MHLFHYFNYLTTVPSQFISVPIAPLDGSEISLSIVLDSLHNTQSPYNVPNASTNGT